MPDQPRYRRQVLDHLGLVAGMFDELGIGDVLDPATHQHPEMRDRTVGEAVKARCSMAWGVSIKPSPWSPGSSTRSPPTRLFHPAWPPTTQR